MSLTSVEFKPDQQDNSPLYMQIARKLSDDVRNGRYQVDQMQFMRFNGKSWERFGELQTGN